MHRATGFVAGIQGSKPNTLPLCDECLAHPDVFSAETSALLRIFCADRNCKCYRLAGEKVLPIGLLQ